MVPRGRPVRNGWRRLPPSRPWKKGAGLRGRNKNRMELRWKGQARVSSPKRSPLLSAVVPCANEESVLLETHRRLTDTLRETAGASFEIVYVDDGSTDATPRLLRRLQQTD